jgi:hypothetical protein
MSWPEIREENQGSKRMEKLRMTAKFGQYQKQE